MIWSHLVSFGRIYSWGNHPSPSMDGMQSQRKDSLLVGSRLALWGRQKHLKALTWFRVPASGPILTIDRTIFEMRLGLPPRPE